ncbi:MAG: PilZ domain-containing protein [Desulfomicrobium sp.]
MRSFFLTLVLLLHLAPLPGAAQQALPTPMSKEEIAQSKTMEQTQAAIDVSLNVYSKHDATVALYIQLATLAVGVVLLILSATFMVWAVRKLKIMHHLHRRSMERRESIRYPMATDKSVALLHTPSGDMTGAPVDISESGIQIVLKNAVFPPPKKVTPGADRFRLSLMLPDNPAQSFLDATCTVAWISGQRCGLRFEIPIPLPPLFERQLILGGATA